MKTALKNNNSRLEYMDVAKGIGILLVVIGHLSLNKWLDFGIYSFHMPLFFMISGYFISINDNFWQFFLKKFKAYMVPYFCYALIQVAFYFVLSKGDISLLLKQSLFFLKQEGFTTLWFLPTLFLSVILFAAIHKICKKKVILSLIVSFFFMIAGFIYDYFHNTPLYWNIDAAFITVFFVAIGYFLKEMRIFEKIKMYSAFSKVMVSEILMIICFMCSFSNLRLSGESMEISGRRYGIFPLCIIAGIAGSLSIIIISMLLEKIHAFSYLGKESIYIFAFHKEIGIVLFSLLFSMIIPSFSIKTSGFILIKLAILPLCILLSLGIGLCCKKVKKIFIPKNS